MANRLFSFLAGKSKAGMPGFNGNPFPQLVFDRETLQVLAVNNAALDLYGYTREEVW